MPDNKSSFEGIRGAKNNGGSKVYIPIYRVSLVREKSLKAECKYAHNPRAVYQIIKPYLA
jgi:hypothetical protein